MTTPTETSPARGATVERILEVARGHRPLSFADRDAYRGELLAALAVAGLEVRGDCRVFGGRVDLLVSHADTVAVVICPAGRDADAEVQRRLRRLAAGGDLDALILLTTTAVDQVLFGSFDRPVHVARIPGTDDAPEALAA